MSEIAYFYISFLFALEVML